MKGNGKSITISGKDFKKKLDAIAKKWTDRGFSIIEAVVKDEFCNYKYEVTEGIGVGDQHTVTGTGIVEDDMMHAFAKFNVHLAVIDEVFKNSKTEVEDIDMFHNHELTLLYRVNYFKIKSSKGYETIVLKGTKYVSSAGGWMELKSPEITLDNLSSYNWYNELKDAANNAREEVALYKEGKYTAVEKEKEEKKQPDLFDEKNNESIESDLEGAKV
jgi:hypothetical protein